MRRNLILGAGMAAALAFGQTLDLPRVAIPAREVEAPRPKDGRSAREKRRSERAQANARNREARRARRLYRRARLTAEQRQAEALTHKLTNWQRSRWAAAGYPRSVEALQRFAAMRRRG